MSHYDDLPDEDKITLASEAVAINAPIPPAIYRWLQDNGLLYRVTNP